MKIVIYGNGAMAKVFFSYARRSMDVCGFTVDDICITESSDSFCGMPLVPFSKVQEFFDPKLCKMIIAMGFIDMNDLREKKYLEAKEKGYSFTTYIHDSVLIHDDVTIDENCIILDHVLMHPGCKIGQGAFISGNVSIGHDCIIEAYNYITSGVSIAGGCHIGRGSFFGINSSVAHGIHVGARNFISANTLLNKSTNDDEVYLSDPGQLFRLNSKAFLRFGRVLD
jgi:sugar O-acyltransferase (sialic acid O-acetyltransferase NeuD family)